MQINRYDELLAFAKAVKCSEVEKSTLVNIKDIKINHKLPQKERITDYINQIKNPYCYIDRGIVVKLSFVGEQSLEDCLVRYIANMQTQKSHN